MFVSIEKITLERTLDIRYNVLPNNDVELTYFLDDYINNELKIHTSHGILTLPLGMLETTINLGKLDDLILNNNLKNSYFSFLFKKVLIINNY